MNRNFFLIFLFFLLLTGCASVDRENPPPVAKPENVIRSGRKDPLLKSDYVLEVLGKPDVKRYEKPSEVWTYSKQGCVLFVYMVDQADGSKLVRHMEIGTPTFKAKEKNSVPCLREASKLR